MSLERIHLLRENASQFYTALQKRKCKRVCHIAHQYLLHVLNIQFVVVSTGHGTKAHANSVGTSCAWDGTRGNRRLVVGGNQEATFWIHRFG